MTVITKKAKKRIFPFPKFNIRISPIVPYLLVVPAVILLVVFVIYPIVYLFYVSMTSGSLLSGFKFVGMDNFTELFHSNDFIMSLTNTIEYTFMIVALTIVLSTLLAVWLNKKTKLFAFAQGAVFTPHIVSLVSVSLVWLWLMDPQVGLLNAILKMIGLSPFTWVSDPNTSLVSVVFVMVWKSLGYYTLLVMAALQGIPANMYEAAELDDASKITTFFKITVPMISPTLFFILIVSSIGSFQVFDVINLMTQGGPISSTNMLVYFIYEYAFKYFKIGYASAAGVVLLLCAGVLTLLYFSFFNKKVHYQ